MRDLSTSVVVQHQTKTDTPHPAVYSAKILSAIETTLNHYYSGPVVLDPFAGTGAIHSLRRYATVGVELEPEWAEMSSLTILGDATSLPFANSVIDSIVTSPCLEQSQRILTNELTWIPVGDIKVGQEILAFEESGAPNVTGTVARRHWQRGAVVRSEPRKVDCVRVVMANGDEVITTPEHPWLAWRYSYGGTNAEWIPSSELLGSPGLGFSRHHRKGERQPYFVSKQLSPWKTLTSFDAGWLSGMFDGEGSVSLGHHGAPKLYLCQNKGPVLDRAHELLEKCGYNPNLIYRDEKLGNLYVRYGFPGLLTALGQLRPIRLLNKWLDLDVSSRTVQAAKVKVIRVEPAGMREIQEIETSTGTFIGEGYLHHNCYGNRMADHHNAKDDSYRRTYRHCLGRPLSPNSAGGMQWGQNYRDFHIKAWSEAARVIRPGGLFILNIKDHRRAGKRAHVSVWHAGVICSMGFRLVSVRSVSTPGFRFGANLNHLFPERLLVFVNLGTAWHWQPLGL